MLKEEHIFVQNNNVRIEALLHKTDGAKAAVVCHPHPLMGGSMRNNVVEAVVEALASKNIATARFNFRGVGLSSGAYDEGRGEVHDVISVHRHLQEAGYTEIYFAGYSFGAWIGANTMGAINKPFSHVIFISPPDKHFKFDYDRLKEKVDLIICGSADNFCDLAAIDKQSEKIGAKLEIIDGADHFYWGYEEQIRKIIHSSA